MNSEKKQEVLKDYMTSEPQVNIHDFNHIVSEEMSDFEKNLSNFDSGNAA